VILTIVHNLGVFRAGIFVRDFEPDGLTNLRKYQVEFGQSVDAAYIPTLFLMSIGAAIIVVLFLTTLPEWLDIDDDSDKSQSKDSTDQDDAA